MMQKTRLFNAVVTNFMSETWERSDLYDLGFNVILDKYLTTGEITASDYESMTPKQKEVIQCFKRAIKRITKE